MEWRIRESSRGDFVAEYGGEVKSGTPSPTGIGFLMPAFIVYEAARFDTKRQAESYIKRRTKA